MNATLEQAVRAEGVLVQKCREGDSAAWNELHRRYFPVAGAFLRKLGVSEQDLNDASQEVFLQAFRYLPQYRQEAQLQTWLYRLCITQARSLRRRSKVVNSLKAVFLREPKAHPAAIPGYSESEALAKVNAALRGLTPRQREAFVLFEMEGQSGQQTAEIMGCTEASVWRLLHHARANFRRFVEAAPEADKP